jgi:predicted transposase YbfD/YdcC
MIPIQDSEELKQTNEIKTAVPLLKSSGLDLTGKDITGDALLTQRTIATDVRSLGAHYHLTVKGNQPKLLADLELQFRNRSANPDFTDVSKGHGRIETRSIWVTSALNDYLDFPDVGQAFLIQRQVEHRKNGKTTKISSELAHCITSRPSSQASPERLLQINRGHWTIENRCHHVIDWNFDEDRSRIRKGHGPENVTRLRRFAVCLIQSKSAAVAKTLRRLNRNVRTVFDFLFMSENSRRRAVVA